MDNTALKNAFDLCALVRCALEGERPKWEEMDLQAVHKLAQRQTLTAISYMALEGTPAEKAVDSAWKQERDMAVRKNLLLTAERQQILKELDGMGCWYLPLKGSILADMYPRLGMRQMADNDILFDATYRKEVKALFLRRGYTVEAYGKGNHDVYQKAPVYNYEMHVSLFGISVSEVIEKYYREIENRLLPENGMGRKLSDEDFYLYFLAHSNKHYSGSGNGLRFLMDCAVYLQKKTLDWAYVSAELQKLELTEFEALARSTAQKLFVTGQRLEEAEMEMFSFCVGSGTYGTQKKRIDNALRQIQPEGKIGCAARWKYLLRWIWPEQRWFQAYAPFFAKWRILKPFFVIWRCIRAAFLRRKFIAEEIRLISEVSVKNEKTKS